MKIKLTPKFGNTMSQMLCDMVFHPEAKINARWSYFKQRFYTKIQALKAYKAELQKEYPDEMQAYFLSMKHFKPEWKKEEREIEFAKIEKQHKTIIDIIRERESIPMEIEVPQIHIKYIPSFTTKPVNEAVIQQLTALGIICEDEKLL